MSDETHDQIHENALLASVYLDGEATSDERALVETSPDTLAEVAALSQVRDVLIATAPEAALSERESHLAGALDVWERMSDLERSGEATPSDGVDAAAAAAVLTPISSSDGRRGRSGRSRNKANSLGASQWLLGAAATLLIVVGAAAVLRGIVAEDASNDATGVESGSDDPTELSEVEVAEAKEVAGGDVGDDFVPAATDLTDDVANNPDVDNDGLFDDEASPAASTRTDAAEESEASADSASDTESPALDEQPPPAPEFARVELETPEDLADYGSLAVRPIAPGGPVTTADFDDEPPQDSCEARLGLEKRLLPALYRGEEVNVGVDIDKQLVIAYTDDCRIVASVPVAQLEPQP